MTKNDAWVYARANRRKQHTNATLEKQMQAEGYTEEDIRMVKSWLFNYGRGV